MRAANWIALVETAGRGRMDVTTERSGLKSIFVFFAAPACPNSNLCAIDPPSVSLTMPTNSVNKYDQLFSTVCSHLRSPQILVRKHAHT
jgi:hypothetical protein